MPDTPPARLPMLEMITLEVARRIIDAAIARARELGIRPMAFVVLDAGGQVVAYNREDYSGILRFEIAHAKAFGALGMNRSSRNIANMARRANDFIASVMVISDGRLCASPGGVLIRNAEGRIIGAVGSTGDAVDADEACAIAGIHAVGLRSDPAEAVPPPYAPPRD
jgi:uncharacterized protein GlcG (DUF336 family)